MINECMIHSEPTHNRCNKHRERIIHTPLPNHVIDNDGVRVLQQAGQFHGNLREPHARTGKDLNNIWLENRRSLKKKKHLISPQALKHQKAEKYMLAAHLKSHTVNTYLND